MECKAIEGKRSQIIKGVLHHMETKTWFGFIFLMENKKYVYLREV